MSQEKKGDVLSFAPAVHTMDIVAIDVYAEDSDSDEEGPKIDIDEEKWKKKKSTTVVSFTDLLDEDEPEPEKKKETPVVKQPNTPLDIILPPSSTPISPGEIEIIQPPPMSASKWQPRFSEYDQYRSTTPPPPSFQQRPYQTESDFYDRGYRPSGGYNNNYNSGYNNNGYSNNGYNNDGLRYGKNDRGFTFKSKTPPPPRPSDIAGGRVPLPLRPTPPKPSEIPQAAEFIPRVERWVEKH